jgi:hypothetical protein
MNRIWRGLVLGGVAVVALQHPAAQVKGVDAERLLAERFGFTAAEVAQARSGEAVVKTLPTLEAGDAGVVGAVRIDGTSDRLLTWLKDVSAFRKAAELGVSRRLSNPPAIGDFGDLSLDSAELADLRKCRPGDCDLMIGDKAIQRFQTEIDWSRADAATRANLLMRQLLLSHVEAYLKGGNRALGAVHNEKTPRVYADEFQKVLGQSRTLHDLAPALVAYLDGFPAQTLPGSEQFLYWSKATVGSEPSTTLHQLVIYNAPGGDIIVVDKQLYASRYVDTAMTIISMASSPTGNGFYAIAGARGRSTKLRGVGARVLNNRVESAIRDTTKMYLDWLRASLTL